MQLELGDIALIVGGGSGIGLATARRFAAEGCQVAVWDLAETHPELTNIATYFQADVRNRDSVTTALTSTIEQLGPIHHVVITAAVGSGHFGMPFTNVPPETWDPVFAVNVTGLANVADAVAKQMIQQGFGTIVSVASVAGQVGSPTDPPYSASKAAGINFAQCMARDLAPHGIRVNTVCPGMVKTPLNQNVWKSWRDRDPQKNTLTYDDWAEQKIKDLIPLGQWQQPEDIADMILFLSSRRAAQVTGQTINVDGGYVMHW